MSATKVPTEIKKVPLPTRAELEPAIVEAIMETNRIDAYGHSNLIVGIMHRIWVGAENLHLTSVYYADGTVKNVEGLLVGRQYAKDHFYNVMALKALVQMIPFLAAHVEGDYLLNIGTEEEIKNESENAKDEGDTFGFVTLCYVFRPPSECPLPMHELKGYEVLENAIQEMATDHYTVIKEGEF